MNRCVCLCVLVGHTSENYCDTVKPMFVLTVGMMQWNWIKWSRQGLDTSFIYAKIANMHILLFSLFSRTAIHKARDSEG